MSGDEIDALRRGGKPAVARMLAALETTGGLARHAGLLDRCLVESKGLVIGLTGPPGVGKSTLTAALIRRFRASGESVAVVAVDPSSRASGGALLGDRTRLRTDPDDAGVFVRSMAARSRLGGLSDHAAAACALFSALYDRVLVETVGIGQSEADVSAVADVVVLCIQPGSGDSLQFMKAGVMEIPDVIAVTKADMGPTARRALADVTGALSLAARPEGRRPATVLALSAATGEGMDVLVERLAEPSPSGSARHGRARRHQVMVEEALRAEFGARGLAAVDVERAIREAGGPFRGLAALTERLAARLGP